MTSKIDTNPDVLPRDVFGDETFGKQSFLVRWWSTVDTVSIGCIISLCLIGLLLGMASSAGLAERHNLDDFYFVKKQAVFCGLAMAIMAVTSMIPQSRLVMICKWGMMGTIASICALPLLGTDFGKGAIRWYSLGGFSVQPSEFFKPVFAVACGSLMGSSDARRLFTGVHGSAIVVLFVITILALQPDFGQAGLIFASWLLMYLVSGSSLVGMSLLGGVVAAGGFLAYLNSEHVARRINTFLAQEVDPTEQIGYSLRAIENGGMFGAGIGEGSVKFALPDAHTDFIIAVAAEEYGFVLVASMLLLYLRIVIRSFVRLMHDPNHQARVVGAGLAGLFGMQALINAGVSVKFFPAKGMTLPFVSYGGSSAIAMGITAGLLLAFTKRNPPAEGTKSAS